MQVGELFANRYRLIKEVGRGSFGEVWQVRDEQLDLEVALKVYIALDERGLEEFKGEYKNTYALNHPNLLHATYFGVDEKRPYLVMPYCPASAVGLLGGIDEGTAWRFLRDVAGGLAYLHGQDILHRDIKPDNILRNEAGDFVITDFGISLRMRSTLRRNSTRKADADMGGSIPYMGPEMFSANPQAVKATDIWALGVSLFELMSGDLPFFGQGGGMLLRGAEIPAIPGHFSEELKKTVQSCLAKETWNRPTAEQLRDYAEAKLQGRNPVKTWGEPNGSAEAKDGTTGKSESGKVEPTVTPKVEVAEETARQGRGNGKKNRIGVLVAVVMVVIAVLTTVGVLVQQSSRREKAEREREQVAMAERARQDRIADAQAEMQRQAREAEERRQAEEARQKAEQERERQAAEAKAEQERLAQLEQQRQEQERQRQEEVRKQREAEARRRATSNRTIRVGNVSFEMVYVQGGTFRMGATVEQGSGASSDEKVHSVTLSDFHIGKYEVTQGLWKEVMGENPSDNKAGDNYPVETVSWEDCQRFIERLNNRTGLHFRLPTEAEWEYAARGGRKSRGYKYSGTTYDLESVAWYDGNSDYATHPVGQKQANELGLYDMSGNVWEWCQDWYGSYGSSAQTDPTGPQSGANRVMRGGCYGFGAWSCRVSYRNYGCPGCRGSISGLRLVLAP